MKFAAVYVSVWNSLADHCGFCRHQATVVCCTSKDEVDGDAKFKWLMLVAGCMMAGLQCCTATAVVGSTFMQACTTNNQCPLDMQGQLCSATRRRCLYCGTPPLEIVEIAPDGTASLVTDMR
eukprot:SAG31_NODE_6627_length_1945_cov_5.098592_4_plen_121_part_01